MNRRLSWYNALIIIFVFLILTSLPFYLFVKDQLTLYLVHIAVRLIFLGVYIILIRRYNLPSPELQKLNKKSLLFIPFILICGSNGIVSLITKASFIGEINYTFFFLEMGLALLIAIIEELIFRVVLLNQFLMMTSKFKAMLFTSLIFGALHLFNINSIASILPTVVQSIYTFGLGMVFSLIYLDTKNVILPILLHFLFNFLNDYFFAEFFNYNWDLYFYLISAGIALVMAGYWCFIYFYIDNRPPKRINTYDA